MPRLFWSRGWEWKRPDRELRAQRARSATLEARLAEAERERGRDSRLIQKQTQQQQRATAAVARLQVYHLRVISIQIEILTWLRFPYGFESRYA
jgi:hypothetical protein